MSLIRLFLTFLQVGTFTIGGGLVAITIMQQILVTSGLITPEKFYTMVAISESTPGPIGINMATYIGCELYGPFGGVVATVAEVLPSIICILIIARYFHSFQNKPLVKGAFYGLRPAVSGMIAVAAWNVIAITLISIPSLKEFVSAETRNIMFLLKNFFNVPNIVFFACAVFILFKTKIHPLIIIALGAVFGILVN
jgi:chromate transporter